MCTQADALIKLASDCFNLTESECYLLKQATAGKEASYLPETDIAGDAQSDPSRANTWTESRTLRAEILVWLCTDADAQKFITFRGVKITGAKIEGVLDLTLAVLTFPLVFQVCAFTNNIRLEEAKIRSLDLQGSILVLDSVDNYAVYQRPIVALLGRTLQVEFSISLSNGFKAMGKILLDGAVIGGNLDCTNATFGYSEYGTYTLEAQNLEVKGSVLLHEGFKATGGVSLDGSVIEGALKCTNSTFENSEHKQYALRAQNIKVKGNICLDQGFKAVGEVLLDEATIGGSLKCSGGSFLLPQNWLIPAGDSLVRVSGGNFDKNFTLAAQNLELRGSAWFNDGFKAMGRVTLNGSTIGGNLVCDGGTFGYPTRFRRSPNAKDHALYVQNMNVHGSVVMRNGFKAMGVDFFRTTIGGSLECKDCTLENFGMQGGALNAQNIEVKGPVWLSDGFKAIGGVSLQGAIVDGDLWCNDARFECSATSDYDQAFSAMNAQVKGNVRLGKNFEAVGEVCLYGVTIDRTLTCKGRIHHPETKLYALIADNMQVGSSVWLSGLVVSGGVSLYGAIVGGNLECKGKIRHPEARPYALMAESMRVSGSVWLSSFKAIGRVSFCNTKIDDGLYSKEKIFVSNSDNSKLDLEFANVRTLADSEKSWPAKGKLLLEGFVYEKLDSDSPKDRKSRLKWINLQNQDSRKGGHFSPQPYEQLAKVLKESGHKDTAREILIAKQDDVRRYGGLGRWGHCWNWFLGITIAHGYKPRWALGWSVAVIILWAVLFHIGYSHGWIEALDLEAYTIAMAEDSSLAYPEFFALTYSLDVFLPVIDLHQASYWIPKASRGTILLEIEFLLLEIRCGGIILAFFWIQIILGWVLTSLWVAGFTGLVRRLE